MAAGPLEEPLCPVEPAVIDDPDELDTVEPPAVEEPNPRSLVLALLVEEPFDPLAPDVVAGVVPDAAPVEEAVVKPLELCMVCDGWPEWSAADGDAEHAASPSRSPALRLEGRNRGLMENPFSEP